MDIEVKKIAYIHIYAGAPVATSVRRMLEGIFPEYQIETFTLTKLLKRRPMLMATNLLHVLKLYGLEAFRNRAELRRRFIATPYLFHRIRELLLSELQDRAGEFVFSFQLQSLFDTHIPGIPHYIYTDHTHLENLSYPEFDRRRLHAPEWLALEKRIYKNASHIFTRSTNISASLMNEYNVSETKVTCAFAGVNVPNSGAVADNDGYANKNILFVGLDWERKGGPALLKAFQDVLIAHPDANLTIVGAQPPVNTSAIKVLGPLPFEGVQREYRKASIFCLPTRLEPFGIVFVEAMSHALPIVATHIGAIPDMVIEGESGYLVAPDDADGLSQALLALLADPAKCKRFGERGQRLAFKRYNWQNVGAIMREHITQNPQPGANPANDRTVPSHPIAA